MLLFTSELLMTLAKGKAMKLATFVILILIAIPGTSFAAVSADVRRACMNDYFRLCSYTGGNVARASACCALIARNIGASDQDDIRISLTANSLYGR